MTDLARSLRESLATCFHIRLPEVHRRTDSADGTCKYLLRLEDGQFIETVHIPEEERDTLCISSQVGCAVGCTFCMTARMGFRRNLRPGEIVGQVLRVIQEGRIQEQGFNIVFMGMGEPLYNYQNVMKAFRLLVDPDGMNLSYRKITVSTSGVVPVLRRMAEEPLLPNLAISLNATTNEIRSRVMPINEKWPLAELLGTLRSFPLEPRRRITIEYVLLRDETDRDEDARRLAGLLRGIPVKVNLIPYNSNAGLPHGRPEESRVRSFQAVLMDHGISGFVRKTRGDDVSAACGQLAYLDQN
jgi:23S rRNA (adenine2503-C2)-methyltransferase